MNQQRVKTVGTESLYIAYREHGPDSGWPVILSHGFPYDVHAFDEVAVILAQAGARVITPYTRGFGPTRFVSHAILRSGQQAARARDIVQLADALDLQRPLLSTVIVGSSVLKPAILRCGRLKISSPRSLRFKCRP